MYLSILFLQFCFALPASLPPLFSPPPLLQMINAQFLVLSRTCLKSSWQEHCWVGPQVKDLHPFPVSQDLYADLPVKVREELCPWVWNGSRYKKDITDSLINAAWVNPFCKLPQKFARQVSCSVAIGDEEDLPWLLVPTCFCADPLQLQTPFTEAALNWEIVTIIML